MKWCLVMQHVAFEDLGYFRACAGRKRFAIRYCPVDEPPTEEEWLAADLAVVLGGAIGVYDQVLYPFLKDEKDLIRKRLESQKAVARHLSGGAAYCLRAKSRVISRQGQGNPAGAWNELTKRAESRLCVFLDGYRPVLHWHGEIRLICPKVLNCWPPPP